jgi:hypothetical protein
MNSSPHVTIEVTYQLSLPAAVDYAYCGGEGDGDPYIKLPLSRDGQTVHSRLGGLYLGYARDRGWTEIIPD